jgi:eukaryotic-like serine/threonine-protein kinase
VKIFDFGLAKLQESEARDSHPEPLLESRQASNPVLTLTRTGTTVGTTAYMSPEQLRGENLDARTDLFSFGLVLYEMAVGQRAFPVETIPELRAAILDQNPTPLRELNLGVPAKLETVINRAVEKDRQLRYQSASEMRDALENLKRDTEPSHSADRQHVVLAGTFALLAAVVVAFWFSGHKPPRPGGLPELKQRQLTFSSGDNPVRFGAISPDGRYLAYADLKGIHRMLIETGESQTIPQPELFQRERNDWQEFHWFPDGTRFLVNQNPPLEREKSYAATIWTVSVLGGPPRKFREVAGAEQISPDGSLIAFTVDSSGPWVMGPNGEDVRKLFDTRSSYGSTFYFRWSPSAQRVAYIQFPKGSIESRDVNGGTPTTILPATGGRVRDLVWLPDGRIISALAELPPNGDTCNLWEIHVDARSGSPRGEPRRLTNWAGICVDNMSASADGKRLAFEQWTGHASVYVANLLESGKRISPPRRITLGESWNMPSAWTPDSKTVVFNSRFNDQTEVLEQRLDEDSAKPILTGIASVSDRTPLSPDASWFLYTTKTSGSQTAQVMRVPATGGSPQIVLTGGNYGVRCAKPPASLCVIAERSPSIGPLIFTELDPLKGRGLELLRLETQDSDYVWDLSPDATRIAVLECLTGKIQILSLASQPALTINVEGIGTSTFFGLGTGWPRAVPSEAHFAWICTPLLGFTRQNTEFVGAGREPRHFGSAFP